MADPALTRSFDRLADIFAPPSATDIYAGTRAASERDKAQRIADFWANRNTMTPEEFDRGAAALALNPVSTGYAGLRTKERGQDIQSGDNRYNTDVTARTARANNADTNRTHVVTAFGAAIPKDAIRPELPKSTADMYGIEPIPQQRGVISAQPGERNVLPDGEVIEGNPKPLTESEMIAKIVQEKMSPEEQRAKAFGTTPIEVVPGPNGPVPKTRPQVLEGGVAPVPKTPGTVVNVGPNGEPYGNPPANMAWKRTPDGKVALDDRGAPIALPIQGTPLYNKEQQAAGQRAKRDQSQQTKAQVVTQDIGRAIDMINNNPLLATGLAGQVLSNVGGTEAHNLRALLDSVSANVGFEQLNQMRQESPTGGALGQVSNRENELLQATLGSLKTSQGGDQLRANLTRLNDIYLDILHGGDVNGAPTAGPARSYERAAVDAAGNKFLVNTKTQTVRPRE